MGISEKPISDNMFEFLSDQYRKFIINRITIKVYNVIASTREVINGQENNMDFTDVTHYPFHENNYEYDNNPGKWGMYAQVFRSFSMDDTSLSMHQSISDRSIRVGLTGGAFRKKSHSFYYYPKCKKAIGTGVANMPGHKPWPDILKLLGVDEPIFQIGFGFGPFAGYPLADTQNVAVEVSMQFEFIMKFDMTFSDRK